MAEILSNWIPVKEAAFMIGCTPQHIGFLMRRGIIEFRTLLGASHRYEVLRADVAAYRNKPKGPGRPRISER